MGLRLFAKSDHLSNSTGTGIGGCRSNVAPPGQDPASSASGREGVHLAPVSETTYSLHILSSFHIDTWHGTLSLVNYTSKGIRTTVTRSVEILPKNARKTGGRGK